MSDRETILATRRESAARRSDMVTYLDRRIAQLAEEMDAARAAGDHTEVAHKRAVQQALAEVHSMLRATAPGEWQGPGEAGGELRVRHRPDPGNAVVDGADAT